MHYIMLDTCVLLDISTRKNDLPIVSALESLVSSELVKLVISDLVIEEFERNKDDVADKTRKRLSYEFKQVKSVISQFGGDEKEKAIEILDDVNTRLPLLSEANYATISRVENLIKESLQINVSDKTKILAVQRGLDKRAPFHINKNSVADAIIIEQFSEYVTSNDSDGNEFIFITHNHNDFSAKDHRQPHDDFLDIFNKNNVHYCNNVSSAISLVDDDYLSDIQFEYDFTEETRGLSEILNSMDELVDKIWINRHFNREYGIENGDIRIVPDETKEHGNGVIHESIWEGAQKAAQQVIEKYEDTGPWDDFEWGMLNGKLSALRWVLGDDWDMLDT